MAKVNYIDIAKRILAPNKEPSAVRLNPKLVKHLNDFDERCRNGGSSLHSFNIISLSITIWKKENQKSKTHKCKKS